MVENEQVLDENEQFPDENQQVLDENETDSANGRKGNTIENGTVTTAALQDGSQNEIAPVANKILVAKMDPKATKCFIFDTVSFHSDVDEVL